MANETQMTRADEGAMEHLHEGRYFRPAVDIFENADELLLYADLPGVAPSDLTVDLENEVLTIQGRRILPAVQGEEEQTCIYYRTFRLPAGVDANKIDAKLARGVLQLHLPKQEALKPRQITVRGE